MKNKNQLIYFLVIAIIFSNTYMIMKINSLDNEIDSLKREVRFTNNNIQSQIRNLNNDIEEKIKRQNSLIESTSLEIGQINSETLLVPITFKIVPKEITNNTRVYLDFDGKNLELKKEYLSYIGKIDFPITKEVIPKIIIENNGVKYIEENEDIIINNLREIVLLNIYADYNGEVKESSNKLDFKGNIHIDYKKDSNGNSIEEIKALVKVNGDLLKEINMDIYDDFVNFKVNESLNVEDGDIVKIYVLAMDSLGFKYESIIYNYKVGNFSQEEPVYKVEKIVSPNGEIIYDRSMK